ncbi:TrmH family RNA methyltransferase [Micromonospora sp. LOL_021]|uniref:TrmH family RNA methyltransferase n=1 Tax=Micromonospora sp. LOL_021 TaxID=3345417 RepID=UPI003A89685C
MTAPRPAGRLGRVPAATTGGGAVDRQPTFTTRTPRIVAARRLHRRRDRDATRRFLAEGPQAVREALAVPGLVRELFTTAAGRTRHTDLAVAAASAGIDVSTVDDAALTALAETVNPQGVVAVCDHLDVSLDGALRRRPALAAVLVEIRDPGNAGTVLRTADAAGAGAVVFAGAAVDPYNGKCVRASAGSLFHVDVVRHDDPAHVVDDLRAAGLRVLATTGHGDTDLDDLADSGALAAPTAWLFGTEAHGLPAELAERADARVRVPLHGRAESLNLASAAAVCLYTSARAQRPGRPTR